MGLLKQLAKKVVGAVNDVAGTNFSVGKSSGGSSEAQLTNTQKAMLEAQKARMEFLKAQLIASGVDADVAKAQALAEAAAWIPTAEGQKAVALVEANLNNGSPAQGSVIKDILNSAVSTAKTALNNQVTKVIDRGGGALLSTPILRNAKPISQTLGSIGSDSLQETTKQFLKKHWYWLLIPFGFVGALVYVTVKSSRKGGRKGKNRF